MVTLPKALRDAYGLEQGAALGLLDLGGVFVLLPRASGVDAAAGEIESLREEASIEVGTLTQGMRAERERYAREQYPGLAPTDDGA